MKLDVYYDVTCDHCNRTRSMDYEKGYCENKNGLIEKATLEGWVFIENQNVCPICAKINHDHSWKSIDDIKPPINKNWTGINSRTKNKYMVLTKEGHIVEGYIYENRYSCSGYAVWCGGEDYLNNVTHWVPTDIENGDNT